jgi:2-keto-4-pentenoate hydratase/2-oxohepta-3-ene-1,7-dioic acid hydratase in catechol pathway
MKLSTFLPKVVPQGSPEPSPRLGALADDDRTVIDLQAAATARDGSPPRFFSDALSLLDGGEEALDQARAIIAFSDEQQPPDALHAIEEVSLLAPVPRPRSIRDCLAFEKHLVQATRTVVSWRFRPLALLDAWVEKWRGRALIGVPKIWYEQPIYYTGNPLSVIGPEAEVRWPSYTQKLDYELEFGIFIGRKGRDISKTDASDYIAGYTIFNDFSARDTQLREMKGRLGPTKGKNFDTGNAMGPYLVTADEIPDPYDLTMVARVNGEEWSRGSSSDMFHRFEDMIVFISQDETILPGDFIGSGTVGNGCGLELDRWLEPGDVVELEVEGLGVLRNHVVRSS